MIFKLKPIAFLILLFMSCQSGKLTVVGSIDSDLEEASAAEIVNNTNIVWTSTDDGETWTDHGGDEQLVSNGIGMAQWYMIARDVLLQALPESPQQRKPFVLIRAAVGRARTAPPL